MRALGLLDSIWSHPYGARDLDRGDSVVLRGVPLADRPSSERETKRNSRLAELDRRIKTARDAGQPKPRADKEKYAAMSLGWRMVIELVLSVMIGAAMGWGLDSLLGSLPLFLIVFVMLGFAAGVRSMLRTANDMQLKGAEPADDERA